MRISAGFRYVASGCGLLERNTPVVHSAWSWSNRLSYPDDGTLLAQEAELIDTLTFAPEPTGEQFGHPVRAGFMMAPFLMSINYGAMSFSDWTAISPSGIAPALGRRAIAP